MADDRKKRPRWGDDERIGIGRAIRQRVPVHIDPEATPAPQAPPPLDGLDTPEQLRLLAKGLGDLTVAVGRVWDERGNGERIGKLESAVVGYTMQVTRHQESLDTFIMPGVKALLAATETARLAQVRTDAKLERTAELLDGIAETLKDLVTRIGGLEKSVERLTRGHETLEERIASNESKLHGLDGRMSALERIGRDQAVEVATKTKISNKAGAALVGAGGAIAFVVERLLG